MQGLYDILSQMYVIIYYLRRDVPLLCLLSSTRESETGDLLLGWPNVFTHPFRIITAN